MLAYAPPSMLSSLIPSYIVEKPLYIIHRSSLFPLSCHATRWRLDLYWSFLDLVPIRAECSASTLLETFHHRLLSVVVGIGEKVLEKLVESAVAAHVGIFCACFRLFRVENRLSDIVPILTRLRKGCPGLRGRSRDASRVGES
jgi:hypothetical protein